MRVVISMAVDGRVCASGPVISSLQAVPYGLLYPALFPLPEYCDLTAFLLTGPHVLSTRNELDKALGELVK